MVLFPTQHVLSCKDGSQKSISADASAQESGCMFSDLLQNIVWQNLILTGKCNTASNNDNINRNGANSGGMLSEKGLSVLNAAFMHCDVLGTAVIHNESTLAMLQNNMITNMPGEPGNMSAANTSYTQSGALNALTAQNQLSIFDNAVTKNQTFSAASVDFELNKTAKPLILEVLAPDITQQLYGMSELEPVAVVTDGRSEGIGLTVKAEHEINADTENSSLYPVNRESKETSSLLEVKSVYKQDANSELKQSVNSKPRKDITPKLLSIVDGNGSAEGLSRQSESRSQTSQKGQTPVQGYIMTDSNNPLQEELTSPIWVRGQDNNQEIVMQLAERINVLLTSRRSEMEIHIKPEELGRIVLKVVLENGAMSVKITAESQFVKDFLESHQHELKSLLAQEGYDLAHLDVNVGGMYQQPQWNDSNGTAWFKDHINKTQKIKNVTQVKDQNMIPVVCHGERQNRIDCFA